MDTVEPPRRERRKQKPRNTGLSAKRIPLQLPQGDLMDGIETYLDQVCFRSHIGLSNGNVRDAGMNHESLEQ
jgi:hypothetical protein